MVRKVFAVGALFLLLVAVGCNQGESTKPTPTPTVQAPSVSGDTINDKALSIARVVSWGNEKTFVVPDGFVDAQSLMALSFMVLPDDTREFLGLRDLGGPDDLLLRYTLVMTATSRDVENVIIQEKISAGVAMLLSLTAKHLTPSSAFAYVVIELVHPSGDLLYCIVTQDALILERAKQSPSWSELFENNLYNGEGLVLLKQSK